MAIEAGTVEAALQTVDDAAKSFAIDALTTKAEAAEKLDAPRASGWPAGTGLGSRSADLAGDCR